MKRLFAVLLLCAIAVPLSAHGVHRFDNGLWFDGTRFVPRTMWSVDGVFRQDSDRPPDSVTDLKGAFVIPPFADAHHHAFADGRDPAETIAKFLRDGVFYVKNPNNLPRLAAAVRPRVNLPESVDVIYSNGGFTSTGGHPSQIYAQIAPRLGMRPEEMAGEAYFIVDRAEDLDAQWTKFLATKPDFAKVYLERTTHGLQPALVPLIVSRAHKAGLTVSAHVATAADFRDALAAGVDEITHLPVEKLTVADAREAARRRIRVVTTTISHRPIPSGTDIDSVHTHNIKLLRDAGVTLALGTDNDPTVVAEAENLSRLGVLDAATLLDVATRVTAATIFPQRRIGRLEPGYEASFLALEGNPLDDFRNVRRIAVRIKQGHALRVAAPAAKPLLTERLVPVVMAEGAEAAIRAYDRMRVEDASAYDTGERTLNQLGYVLLQHGRMDDAIVIFTANVERFLSSANVYDSLGEAFMRKGDKASAIRNYEKSLELNPHNENAVAMLKKLRE